VAEQRWASPGLPLGFHLVKLPLLVPVRVVGVVKFAAYEFGQTLASKSLLPELRVLPLLLMHLSFNLLEVRGVRGSHISNFRDNLPVQRCKLKTLKLRMSEILGWSRMIRGTRFKQRTAIRSHGSVDNQLKSTHGSFVTHKLGESAQLDALYVW
jgi:hypothetical protein